MSSLQKAIELNLCQVLVYLTLWIQKCLSVASQVGYAMSAIVKSDVTCCIKDAAAAHPGRQR